jgi:rhamnosyltransferase
MAVLVFSKTEKEHQLRRACVFAHFDAQGIVATYVLYYLEALRPLFDQIIFVSTAELSERERAKTKPFVDGFFLKPNYGYDFGSWQFGLQTLQLDDFDELILCNDSCYGPFFSLGQIFEEMDGISCDFWGITNSLQASPHIQSYFMVFKKSVIKDSRFREFWNTVTPLASKIDYILEYEIGLSTLLSQWGYHGASLLGLRLKAFDFLKIFVIRIRQIPAAIVAQLWFLMKLILAWIGFRSFVRKHQLIKLAPWGPLFEAYKINFTHVLWALCLKRGLPFLKVELLRGDPLKTGISLAKVQNSIRGRSGYNLEHISRHLEQSNGVLAAQDS